MPLYKQTAFILINAEVGYEAEVLKELEKIPEVKEACQVYGVYDIVAKLEAAVNIRAGANAKDVADIEKEASERLKKDYVQRIRGLPNVRGTLTMIVQDI